MYEYETLLNDVFENGKPKGDRTGVGTRSLFGTRMEFDLQEGFPLITTKKVFTKAVIAELLWFLSGSTNNNDLVKQGAHIWDEWADKNGELGPIYGWQWRSWATAFRGSVDQINDLMTRLHNDPDSRRHIVSAWNVADIPEMALAPCHALFQFDIADGKLSLQLYQRSADMFLGVPFNIASYALLQHMVAAQLRIPVDKFVWVGGDTHIYHNHVEQVMEQLSREPYPYPKLELKPADSIFDYTPDHFNIVGYRHHPAISAPVAV